MKKQKETGWFIKKPKKKRKGIHSKNNKLKKKYRGQGR